MFSSPITKASRRVAYRMVFFQAILVVSLAIVWGGVSSIQTTYSVLLGGAACVLPSFYFARKLFATTSAREARAIARAFFFGEFIKLLLSGVSLVTIILLMHVQILPVFMGFVIGQFGFWLAPLFVKLDIKSNIADERRNTSYRS